MAGLSNSRRGQVMLITALGMIIVLAAFIPLFAHLRLSSDETDSDFRNTVNQISLNFKEALIISSSEVSQALELKSRVREYEYTSLNDYPTAESIGLEFLAEWQNETSLQYSGIGLSLNLSHIAFECEWASFPFHSNVNGTIEFDIQQYGFEGWKYNLVTGSYLHILGLDEQDGNNLSFFFRLSRENEIPVNDLEKTFIKLYYNSTDGKFRKANNDLMELYPVGDGKYLVKFYATDISDPPCIKMVLQDSRGIIVAVIPPTGVVLSLEEDYIGPKTLNLNYDPKPTQVNTSSTITGSIDDTETGWSLIASAEYFVDAVGSNGTGTPMLAADGSFDSYVETVEATIDVSGWTTGNYTIYVHGLDAKGNWGNFSDIIVEIVDEQIMYVYNIAMSYETQGFLFWRQARGIATITIYDTEGYPVENADVAGTWSDATSDTDSGLTGAAGQATLKSDWVWVGWWGNPTFTFTVDDVSKAGWTYDPDLNNETSDTVEYP